MNTRTTTAYVTSLTDDQIKDLRSSLLLAVDLEAEVLSASSDLYLALVVESAMRKGEE